jgi:uncharacterized membrane protein YidH (DUF202 family)
MDENLQLALIRTLLAAERNYLAVERTQLSQLRTGLSIALISPSVAATFTFIISYVPEPIQLELVVFFFLLVLTIYGIYFSFSSYHKLKEYPKYPATNPESRNRGNAGDGIC